MSPIQRLRNREINISDSRLGIAATSKPTWNDLARCILVITATFLAADQARCETNIAVMPTPSVELRNDHYVSNREPLVPNSLIKLPVGSVKPLGWLLETLDRQRNGLTGRLPEVSAWMEKEGNAWLSSDGRGKWGWEEVPYWLRGAISLAYLMDDPELEKEVKVWIDAVLAGQRSNGHFGPLRVFGDDDSQDLWANMVMLDCLQTYYEHSQDQRVLELMSKYFRFQQSIPDEKLFTHFWQFYRGGDNLQSVYWLYDHTGESWLLDLGEKIHRNTADWGQQGKLPNWHNVNVAQAFGEPATYYIQSHNKKDLAAAYDNFYLARKQFGQVPGGMFGADENARAGYYDPRQAIETCGVVEQMLSDEALLGITGDTLWADHIEEVAFNTLVASFMPDYRSLRYLVSPNLVRSDRRDHAPGIENIGPMFVMNPLSHRCCQHNHSVAWPRFVEHLWMATQDNGICASLYGPSSVRAKVADGVEVHIEESTRYPFEEETTLKIDLPQPTMFPLYLRIPSWCMESEVYVNETPVAENVAPSDYVRIIRTWKAGDVVTLKLPMKVSVRRWKNNRNSVSVNRGPLVFSLRVGEQFVECDPTATAAQDSQWQEGIDLEEWRAFEILPSTPWNYGLMLDQADAEKSFTVEQRPWPSDNYPFNAETTPIALKCNARRIPQWNYDLTGLCAPLQDSPIYSNEQDEQVTLIPMGAALLRVSAFPEVRNDRNLPQWKAGIPTELDYTASASHCFELDSVTALVDEQEPCASNDRGIQRHSFLPYTGTKEWLQADFDYPRTIDQVSIYWCDDSSRYDDAPTGNFENTPPADMCRVPKQWRLLYLADGQWQEVRTNVSYGVDVNRYNTLNFEPVSTTALRIEVELMEGSSAGVLEWQIGSLRGN